MMEQKTQPDPTKPWCKVCRDHTPFQEKIERSENHTGYSYWCKHCDETQMYIPRQMATAGKISFGIFAFTPLFIGTAYALSENDLKKIYLAVGIACMGACISFWINHRYSNWRKWAKENGYVEE
jgi:hypothetical protein